MHTFQWLLDEVICIHYLSLLSIHPQAVEVNTLRRGRFVQTMGQKHEQISKKSKKNLLNLVPVFGITVRNTLK